MTVSINVKPRSDEWAFFTGAATHTQDVSLRRFISSLPLYFPTEIATVFEPQFGLVVKVTDTSCFFTDTLKLTVPPPLATVADDGDTCICPLLLPVAVTVPVPIRLLTVTLIELPPSFASDSEAGLTDIEHGVIVVPVEVLVVPVDVFVDPVDVFVEPVEVFVEPVDVLVLPVDVFVEPVEVLVVPVDVLVVPVDVLVVPVEVFVEPVDVLVVPVEVLVVPVEVFVELEDVLLLPVDTVESVITSPETLLLFNVTEEIAPSWKVSASRVISPEPVMLILPVSPRSFLNEMGVSPAVRPRQSNVMVAALPLNVTPSCRVIVRVASNTPSLSKSIVTV
jgi:hypothetical protein